MNNRGCLFVVSGFSGSGKGTIMNWFKKQDHYALSVSCTSRKPRGTEQNGVEYNFISHEEFLKRVSEDYFLEYAIYVENKAYGTPRRFVEEQLAAGKDVILEIEMQGAMQVKKTYPDTVLIFITPPSAKELERRLTGRRTETEEQIRKRLHRAYEEGRYMEQYDYIVVNDDLETCIRQLHQLMQSQHLRVSQNREMITRIKKDMECFQNSESEENRQ